VVVQKHLDGLKE